jgi:hypothetical protein
MSADQILVLTSVLLSAAYLLGRKIRARKSSSCGGGCECPKPAPSSIRP